MSHSRSIRWHLIIAGLAVLVPLVLLQGLTLWLQARDDIRATGREALSQAEVIALETEAVIEEMHGLLRRFAERPGIRNTAPGRCDPLLDDVVALLGYVANVWVAEPSGRVLCSGLPLPPDKIANRGDQPWFQAALAAHGPAVGAPYVGLISRRWVSVQTLTLRDAQGEPRLVVGLPLPLTTLRPALGLGALGPGRSAFIVDRGGIIVAHEPDANAWTRQRLEPGLLELIADIEHGHRRHVAPDGMEYIYGVRRVSNTNWFAVATIPVGEAFQPILRGVLMSALAALAVTIVAMLLALISARRIAVPVRALSKAARRATRGDLGGRAPETGPLEIAEFARQFNEMLTRRAEAQAAEARLRRVMEAVRSVQQSYIAEAPRAQPVFEHVLQALLDITDSRFGCLCEVRVEHGVQRLHLQALSGGPNPAAARAMAEVDLSDTGHVFGVAVAERRAVVMGQDDRPQLPVSHPPLDSLLVLPLTWQGRLTGIAALGNRADDYDQELVAYLEPLVTSSANIIDAYYSEQRRRTVEGQLAYLKQYDRLTGLPNRRMLLTGLQWKLERAAADQRRLAVLVFNLDRFKRVNEILGRAAGDALLQRVADRLRRSVTPDDTVARLEGDEFAVVLNEVRDVDALATEVRRLLQKVSQPDAPDSGEVQLTASVGVSMFPADGNTADELLQRAEVALTQARAQGTGAYVFYAPAMHSQAAARLSLETRLRDAVERDELLLFYQPRVELATERMIGVEALLRWQTEGRLLYPEEFVPLAEASDLIVPIGDWVLQTACRQAAAWVGPGADGLTVSVNVSPAQLHHADLVQAVDRALAVAGLPPRRLELEITENLLLQRPDEAAATLTRLRERGVRLAIDDFGTGYSNLAYLKRLPVHKLKIDRSFVRDLNEDPESEAIVKAIIAMARALRRTVTAEGIETREQARVLKLLDCTEGQGFFYGEPVEAQYITARLRDTPPNPS